VKQLPLQPGEDDLIEQAFSAAGRVLAVVASRDAGGTNYEVLFASVTDATNAMRAFNGSAWFLRRRVSNKNGLALRQCPWSDKVVQKASKRVWISGLPFEIDPLRVHDIFSNALGCTFEGKWGYQKDESSRAIFFDLPTSESATNAAVAIKRHITFSSPDLVGASIVTGEHLMQMPLFAPTYPQPRPTHQQFPGFGTMMIPNGYPYMGNMPGCVPMMYPPYYVAPQPTSIPYSYVVPMAEMPQCVFLMNDAAPPTFQLQQDSVPTNYPSSNHLNLTYENLVGCYDLTNVGLKNAS